LQDEDEVTETPDHDLIIAETITLVEGDQSSYNQSITPDVHTDFSFFVSHASGVYYVSLEPWIRELESELSHPQTDGAEFRLQRLLESTNSSVEQYLQRKAQGSISEQDVTSAVVIEDGNVGYILLTTVDNEPHAALLDAPDFGFASEERIAAHMHITGPQKEVREAWHPPKELYEPVDLLSSIHIPARHRTAMKEEVKLSPANLDLLMNVHRVLSAKTARLRQAVSDLFNRAARLQDDFRAQVWRTAQVASKIDEVTGNGQAGSDNGSLYGSARIDERLDKVRSRQEEINARYEKLRNKMLKFSSSELSEKEASLVEELSAMDSAVDKSNSNLTSDVDGSQMPAWQRLDQLKEKQKELAHQVHRAAKDAAKNAQSRKEGVTVPSHSRKQENEQIQEMLARNTVLVDAAAQRLRNLGIGIPVAGEHQG
jgi:nucleoporin NUP82